MEIFALAFNVLTLEVKTIEKIQDHTIRQSCKEESNLEMTRYVKSLKEKLVICRELTNEIAHWIRNLTETVFIVPLTREGIKAPISQQ